MATCAAAAAGQTHAQLLSPLLLLPVWLLLLLLLLWLLLFLQDVIVAVAVCTASC
jgi:hypothetical protein